MPTKPTRRNGGPAYKADFARQVEKLTALGAGERELAEFFQVPARTLGDWAASHNEFRQALTAGRERAKERVEQSLFHRAVGYTFEGVKALFPDDSRTPVLVPSAEHVPPDAKAALAWLKRHCTAPAPRRRGRQRAGDSEEAEEGEKTVIILPPNGRD